MVTVPAVTFERLNVTESLVPATAAVVKPKLALCPVLVALRVRPEAEPILVKVAAADDPEDSIVVTPEEFNNEIVPAPVKLVSSSSIPVSVGATVPVPEMSA